MRPLDRSRFLEDVETFLDIYNRSLVKHLGLLPMSQAEVRHMAKALRWLIVPELTALAELDGKLVGRSWRMPDYNPRIRRIDGRLFPFGFFRLLWNRRQIKRIRLMSANVVPEYQLMGIGLVLARGHGAQVPGLGPRRSRVLLGRGVERPFPRQPRKRGRQAAEDLSGLRPGNLMQGCACATTKYSSRTDLSRQIRQRPPSFAATGIFRYRIFADEPHGNGISLAAVILLVTSFGQRCMFWILGRAAKSSAELADVVTLGDGLAGTAVQEAGVGCYASSRSAQCPARLGSGFTCSLCPSRWPWRSWRRRFPTTRSRFSTCGSTTTWPGRWPTFAPDLVAVTALTTEVYAAQDVLAAVKELRRRGVHGRRRASRDAHAAAISILPSVDAICLGEGEAVFPQFVEAFKPRPLA